MLYSINALCLKLPHEALERREAESHRNPKADNHDASQCPRQIVLGLLRV